MATVTLIGQQICGLCGLAQTCIWPLDAETDTFECDKCGEMAAAVDVAWNVADFPDQAKPLAFSIERRRLRIRWPAVLRIH